MQVGNGEALLVIDMLNDFVLPGAPLEVPLARDVISAIKKRITAARERGVPVIYLCDAHAEDDREFRVWPRHAVKGTEGARVIRELEPGPDDMVFEKTTYSAFYNTELGDTLEQENVARLTIVGILTNICVLFTAADAVMRGFRVEVPRDSVTTLSESEQQFALEQMEKVLKVKVT